MGGTSSLIFAVAVIGIAQDRTQLPGSTEARRTQRSRMLRWIAYPAPARRTGPSEYSPLCKLTDAEPY
jgi:hypothetical protein